MRGRGIGRSRLIRGVLDPPHCSYHTPQSRCAPPRPVKTEEEEGGRREEEENRVRSKKGTGEGRVAIMYASVVVLPQYNIHPYLNYHLFSRLLVSSSLSLSLSLTHTHTRTCSLLHILSAVQRWGHDDFRIAIPFRPVIWEIALCVLPP